MTRPAGIGNNTNNKLSKKTRIVFEIPVSLRDRFAQICYTSGVSMVQVGEQIIADYVDDHSPIEETTPSGA